MEIYLVRHAVAAERDAARWPDDSARPLTTDGARAFAHVARGLRELVATVEFVFSSPYRRAWQTAEILHEEAGWPPPAPSDLLAAPSRAETALELLWQRGQGESVALVGTRSPPAHTRRAAPGRPRERREARAREGRRHLPYLSRGAGTRGRGPALERNPRDALRAGPRPGRVELPDPAIARVRSSG